ncbi:MAG: filamentous hemagglutinin N-terminal domain-containing protein [Burkholderiaceae bacterium]|nr:filamentous hemagglutinin N-terminal domain-containing protein [Burkholderiaceae bacterium]
MRRAFPLPRLALLPALLAMAFAQAQPGPNTLPTGGRVVAGQAQISQNSAQMTVHQTSPRAAIDWQSFNLGQQAQISFQQPDAGSVTLNRVLGGDASQIFGRITSNGQVFLSNPAGIYFGPTARADVGALVATTHGISNGELMAGRTLFERQGATGSVINEGQIQAHLGGYIALLAPEVRNSGLLLARAGTVALAAGEAIELQFESGGLTRLRVTPSEIAALIDNRQAVQAPDGLILLSAQAAQTLQGGVIRHSGSLAADSLTAKGGRIVLEAADITLAGGSTISAQGATGGGTVRIGGDWQGGAGLSQAIRVSLDAGASVDASATGRGDGGSIVLWSDIRNPTALTRVAGGLRADGGAHSGNGGAIETSSSHLDLAATATVSTRAPAGNAGKTGKAGLWLIDPYDYTIGAGEAATLVAALAGTNIELTTTADQATYGSDGNAAGSGNITVNAAISEAGSNSLTLTAANSIAVNAPITVGALTLTGPGGIALGANLTARTDITLNGNVTLTSDLTLSSGISQIYTTASSYVVPAGVNSLTAILVGGGGGKGGDDGGHIGGNTGAVGSLTAAFAVTPGQTLYIAPGSGGGTGASSAGNAAGGSGGSNSFGLASGGDGGIAGPAGSSGGGGGGGGATVLSLTASPNTASALLMAGGGGGGGGSGNNDACPSLCAGQSSANYRNDASFTGQTGANSGNQTPSIQDGGSSGGGGGGLLGGATNPSVFYSNEWTGRGGNHGSSGAANGFANSSLSSSTQTRSNGQDGYARISYGGGTIAVNGTLNGARNLVIDSSSGRVQLNGAIGGGSALSSLDVLGSLGITLGAGTVTSTGVQTYTGPLTLNAAATSLSSSNAAVTLAGSVVKGGGFAGDLSITAGSGAVALNGALGSSGNALGALAISSSGQTLIGGAGHAASFSKTGTGSTVIAGGLMQTAGAQSYTGTVDLSGNTQLTSTGAGDITLNNAISNTSQKDLTISAAGGNVVLKGNLAVGTNAYGPTPIGAVTLTASASVKLGTSVTPISIDAKSLSVTAASMEAYAAATTFTCAGTTSARGICLSSSRSFDVAGASTVSGALSGSGSLTKTGAGKLTLTGLNTYTGSTTISAGMVEIGGTGRLGNGNYLGNISVATQLRFASTANQTLRGTMSGAGFINSPGSGSLTITTLANADNYNVSRLYVLSPGSVYGSSSGTSYSLYTSLAGTTVINDASPTGTAIFTGAPTGASAAGSYAVTYTGGLSLGNERYSLATGTASNWTVAAKPLSVSVSKTYDGSASFGSGFSLSGMVNGDGVPTLSGSASVAGAGAGSYNAFGSSTLVLGNANYTLSGGTVVANIAPASLTVDGLIALSKVYDGTTAAALDTAMARFIGLVGNDQLSLGGATATFADKNVGRGKVVNLSGLTLLGPDAGNYVLNASSAITTADITPAVISEVTGISAAGKVYDGTTAATLNIANADFSGRIGNDQLTVTGGSGQFADKHAGSGKTVSITGLSLAGADAGNYSFGSTSAITTADITPASISGISGVTALSKVYDGSNLAGLDGSNAVFGGMVAGDQLGLTAASGRFTDKNVGNGKSVALSGLALGGADAANYRLASSTGSATADITPALLSAVNGIRAVSRVYDGTTAISLDLSRATLPGRIAGDELLISSASAAFADKHAGTGKPVLIAALSLGGADAGNYLFTGASTMADITPAPITAITGITVSRKVYDGSTTATLDASLAAIPGLLAGDQLSVAGGQGRFADKHAGSGKLVTIEGLSLGGADAGNYRLADTTASATADIRPARIDAITGITASNRVYDGTTAATLNLASATFAGMVGGDALTVASASGAFADKQAGSGKSVSISGLSLGGADAGNYQLADTTARTSADIARAAISAISGITAASKMEDGSTEAALQLSQAQFSGRIGSDALSVAQARGSFDNAQPGVHKAVSITDLVLGGADAGNYQLLQTTASTRADISAKPVPPVVPDAQAPGAAPATPVQAGTGAATSGLISTGGLTAGLEVIASSASPAKPSALAGPVAAAASPAGIIVDLLPSAARGGAGLVNVSVPRGRAGGAGFSFVLPAALQQAVEASGQPATASAADGGPLPGWLRFVPETSSFVAGAVPDGALPFEALVRIGAQSAVIVVSERAE